MVCEGPPKPRQLLVRRRGSFFEDPFFRDAWDDYSHAVRRIVDRFNRGWVSPSDRLRDSQYHSMYRTLRSARLNYCAHSARFKEEGNAYKLVMDVREFVGGDITVRTAGGTVSVRGKLEVSSEEEEKRSSKRFDDDTSSSISGKSSSAKTLHRRFTLPADANCEKIESMLSRDAILTITIPKRTDVHYIPVNIEGEDKENESCVGGRKAHEGARQPSVKRPSDSPPAPTRKKSQDESVANRRGRRNWGDERDHSKFKPKDFDSEDRKGSILEIETEKNRDESNGKRKRNMERKKEEDNLASSRHRRRDKSKYEEVQEINIPIRINKNEPSDKVFRPSSVHESSSEHHLDFSKDLKNSSEYKKESDVDMEKADVKNECIIPYKDIPVSVNTNDLSTRPKNSSIFKKDYESLGKLKETKDKQEENKSFPSRLSDFHFKSKDESEEEEEVEKEDQIGNERIIFPKKEPEREIKTENDSQNGVRNDIWSKRDSATETVLNDYLNKRDSVPSISISRESPSSEISEKLEEETEEYESNQQSKDNEKVEGRKNFPLRDRNNVPKESKSEKESSKDNNLEAPKINLIDRPSSPVSPGSIIVKVGEDPSLMEEGIFKDCWSDFSNTLQDVLSRLQELSSELGHSKVLATTPSAESSPPVTNEDFASDKESLKCDSKDISHDPESCSSTNINKDVSAHGYSNEVGGVGRCKGGSIDDGESAHFPVRTGHGHHKADDLDDDDRKSKDTPQTQQAQKVFKSSQNDAPEMHNTWGNVDFPKSERPSSLNLRSVASPLDKSSHDGQQGNVSSVPFSRPNSLLLSDTAPGSLLESLRKNSPVEILQEDFLRRTASKPSQRKEVYVPVNVDEEKAVLGGGNRKEEERSNSLSPSDAQSNAEHEESESESGNINALENRAQCKLWVDNSDFNGGSESKNVKSVENICVNKEPILNDLSKSEIYSKGDLGEHSSTSSIFEPNIDNSPESNLTDDDDSNSSENLLHTRFTFPKVESNNATTKLTRTAPFLPTKDEGNKKSQPFAVGDVTTRHNATNSDVTESICGANKSHPKIPSDDAMVCERHLPPSSRVPRRGAKEESLRFSRVNRPRDLLLKEVGGDAEVLRESNGDMGGVLSRGRKTPPRKNSESFSENSATNSPSAYSPSPSRKNKSKYPLPQEETPVPPYVRLRTEPKRNSGFGHVNSDNVRRMRDVWGTKQEPTKPPQNPIRSPKVPSSPTRITSRRTSDINDRKSPARSLRNESPCRSDLPSEKGRSSPLRRSSPPPPNGRNSPHFIRGQNRIFKDSSPSPPSPKLPQSYRTTTTTTPSSNSGSRRASQASQASQDRSSPVPSSPCRRCSRNARESPSPSPSLETKPKFNYGSHTYTSEEKKRTKASPSNSFRRESMKSSSAEKTPQASKAHQKIFKRLRDASLQPDSEAICFKEEHDKYKMVLDVEEFVPGEIEVLQDDLVLTVKGRVERKDQGGHIKSVKTFHRTFNIPKNSREEEIDSALSKDGILTIYVPKKRERVIKIELVD